MLNSRKSSLSNPNRSAVHRAAAVTVEQLEERKLFYGATVGVNSNTTFQTMDGFGAAMVTWKNMPEYSDASFYDKIVNDLGATIGRTAIWPTFEDGNDNADPNSFNWAGYDSSAIANAMTFMKRLQDRGMSKLMATVWTPPTFLRTNQTYYYGGTVRPDMRDEFAEYLAAVAIAADRDFGVNLSHISLQNEPFFVQEFESATYSAEQMREAVRSVMTRFAREKLNTQLVVPEEMSKADRYKWYLDALMNDPQTQNFPGVLGVHSGTKPFWDELGDMTEDVRQNLWDTESHGHEQTIEGALAMATDLYNAVTRANASAYLYWQWSEDASDSEHSLMIDGQPGIKYYVAKQIYRYVRPGAIRIGDTSSDARLKTMSFADPKTGAVTHVLINANSSSADVTMNLTGKGMPTSYKAYRTSGSENHVQLANVAGGSQMKITVPANSIVTLYSGPDLQPVKATSGGALPARKGLSDPISTNRLNKAAVRANIGDLREWISQGDDVNKSSFGGYTALHAAGASPYDGATTVISELIKAGAKTTAKTTEGFTPLHFAAMNVWTRGETTEGLLASDKIRTFTSNGADPNAKDNAGRTPLHWAAMMAKLSDIDHPQGAYDATVIDALLDGGASVNAKDNAGFTPLDYAMREGNYAAVKELQRRGGVNGAGAPTGDTTAPTGSITDVSPDPRSISVDSIEIVFTEAVNGVTIDDFALTRNGTSVMPAGAAVVKVNGTTYRVSGLAAATGVAGDYVLKLDRAGSGITDLAGNALANNPSDAWTFAAVGAGTRQTVMGTNANDEIFIRNVGTAQAAQYVVSINGTNTPIDPGADELFIDGLGGNDYIQVLVGIDQHILITGSAGQDTIAGSDAAEELSGGMGRDRVLGKGGNDFVIGGADNDYVNGEEGDDLVLGAGGNDRLYGGNGSNWLIGGNGNDVLFGHLGVADTISGNAGTDTGVDVDDGTGGTSLIDTFSNIEAFVRS
jgi:O-glycosyl hydrolase/ankyrin repeat protein